MKRLVIVFTVLFIFSISALVRMSTGQSGGMMGNDRGGGMMGGGWGWGMNNEWLLLIIITILIIFGIVYMMNRK